MRLCWSLAFASVLTTACGPTAPADGGVGADAGPPRACEADEDCDDGRFCTGEERCVEQVCVPGAPIDCDDGVACSIDSCDDVRGACVNRPPDRDGDGAGAASCLALDGVPLGTDCDDSDPNRFVGNIERCDVADVDEDCDPSTFGAEDLDGDGALSARCCNGETCGTDCDDSRANVGPGALEVCNGLDEDCDGVIDEESTMSGFPDLDADGWGDDSAGPIAGCAGQVRFAVRGGDCDDTNPNVRPGLAELCDSIDNDCDARVDESPEPATWYADADGDGYGDVRGAQRFDCAPLAGFALLPTDCDDTNAAVSPVAMELCNGVDDDCNGRADFPIGLNDFEDDDGDGVTDAACEADGPRDCDDADPRTSNEAFEVCDGRDNDCDMAIDEDAASGVWFPDRDGDGWGDARGPAMVACMPIAGYVARSGDCNERDPRISPSALDVCNGVDDDCDSLIDDGAAASCGPGSSCVAGRCQLECPDGFADCDGAAGNGCEVELSIEAQHCGACGSSCGAAGACVGGRCDSIQRIGVGAQFTCVVRERGGVACWGDNSAGQLAAPPASLAMAQQAREAFPAGTAQTLVVGRAHACIIDGSGGAQCWGDDTYGQLGRGAAGSDPAPAPVVGLPTTLRGLAAGDDHTCAVDSALDAWCWGRGEHGQLGRGDQVNSATPAQVGGGLSFFNLGAGRDFTCGSTNSGDAYCWGRGDEGQLGDGLATSSSTPVLVMTSGMQLSGLRMGARHACASNNTAMLCWGANAAGQAVPSAAGSNVLVPTDAGVGRPDYAAGRAYTLVTLANDRLSAVGENDFGQLGDGSMASRTSYAPVAGPLEVDEISRGSAADHACATRNDGVLFCWGRNDRGQLGIGASPLDPTVPQRVLGL